MEFPLIEGITEGDNTGIGEEEEANVTEGVWDEAFVFENEKKFENGVNAPVLNVSTNNTFAIGKDTLSIYKNKNL